MQYKFTDDLLTYNELIDSEHRNLIEYVNTLFLYLRNWENNIDKVNDSLYYLTNYVNTHFSHENSLMLDYNSPEMSQHMAWHNRFKHELRLTAEELYNNGPTSELIETFLQQVEMLIDHIRTFDMRLASHIQQFLHTI